MIVEPFAALTPVPALITSTVEVFTSNGAFTVTTGCSPVPPVTVTASNSSVDAPAGAAIASGAAHSATSATSAATDARSTRRRRTSGSFVGRRAVHATGGFDRLGRGGTPHAWPREPET